MINPKDDPANSFLTPRGTRFFDFFNFVSDFLIVFLAIFVIFLFFLWFLIFIEGKVYEIFRVLYLLPNTSLSDFSNHLAARSLNSHRFPPLARKSQKNNKQWTLSTKRLETYVNIRDQFLVARSATQTTGKTRHDNVLKIVTKDVTILQTCRQIYISECKFFPLRNTGIKEEHFLPVSCNVTDNLECMMLYATSMKEHQQVLKFCPRWKLKLATILK